MSFASPASPAYPSSIAPRFRRSKSLRNGAPGLGTGDWGLGTGD
ncbi:MAG: hypothetical protein V7K67_09890 [Nostoc sp.]